MWGDLSIGGRILLEIIVSQKGTGVILWTGLLWLRIDSSGCICEP